MDRTQSSISTRLKEAMERAGVRQADLVRATGLDRGAISSYLSGKYEPKQKAIYKIAKALNVSEAWLLGYDVPIYRTDEQKKNDQLAKLIVKLRSDEDFYTTVEAIASLSEKQFKSVKDLVAAFQE